MYARLTIDGEHGLFFGGPLADRERQGEDNHDGADFDDSLDAET